MHPTDHHPNHSLAKQSSVTSDDDQLEAMLQTDARMFQQQQIDNDGFADGVMARVKLIPAPAVTQMTSAKMMRRLGIISAAALVGTFIVFEFGSGNELLIDAVMDLATKTITPSATALMLIIFSAGAVGIGAASSDR